MQQLTLLRLVQSLPMTSPTPARFLATHSANTPKTTKFGLDCVGIRWRNVAHHKSSILLLISTVSYVFHSPASAPKLPICIGSPLPVCGATLIETAAFVNSRTAPLKVSNRSLCLYFVRTFKPKDAIFLWTSGAGNFLCAERFLRATSAFKNFRWSRNSETPDPSSNDFSVEDIRKNRLLL